MAKKTSNYNLSIEERLEQALIPNWYEPYKLPDNWCWVNIGSIGILGMGQTILSKDLKEDGIPVYSATEEDKIFGYISSNDNTIMLSNGDIVIPARGNSIGHVKYIFCNEASCTQTTMFFKPFDKAISKCVYYYMQGNKDTLFAYHGNAIPQITITNISKKEIPIPPLAEQKRIVERIESLYEKLDEAKEKAQEVVDGFETRKAAILHKAFSGELTAKWREENIAKENDIINQIKNLSLEWTTKDQKLLLAEQKKAIKFTMSYKHQWIKCTIGAVAQVNNGSTPSRKIPDYWNGTIPWVSSGEVKNNIIYSTEESISQNGFENASVKLLPVDTVLIAMIGEGKTRGQSAILKIPATINQNIAAIIIDHGLIKSKYLWYWLQMNYSKNREKGSGSGPQALNCQKVRELDFVFPDINEQIEIVRILDILISKEIQVKEIAENVIDQIDTMKKAILARAFRGELGTNDPSEENAVELLKNILTGDYYEDKKNNCKEIQKSY